MGRVGDEDKRDEEEEVESKGASSITRQKRLEAKKKGTNASFEVLTDCTNAVVVKKRREEKGKNRKPLPKERGNGEEKGGAESRVKLDKERLPLQRRGKEKEEK